MYLRSNNRRRRGGYGGGYSGGYGGGRRRGGGGCGLRLLSILILVGLIAGGVHVYNNRDEIQPVVDQFVQDIVRDASDTLATVQAPQPTPTEDRTINVQLADGAWRRGSIQEAVRLYQEIIDDLPNDLTAHYRLTYGLLMQGQIEEAMVAAENTVTANPFSSDAWAIRAWALNRNGRIGEAIASAQRALELQPDNARARAFLAESYAANGNTTRALSEIQRALEADPDSIEAQYVSGKLTWEVQFDFPAAVEQMRAAYEVSDLTYIGVELALMYMSSWINRPQDGVAILNEILERNPENTSALYQLGRYYFRTQGDPNQGITFLTRCINANPESILCHYELGRAQERLERMDEARISFQRAVDLGTQNPYHFWWAGRLQVTGLGDCAAAMRYFDRGYEILERELRNRSERFATLDGLNQLRQDYEAAMAPCRAFNPVPVPADPDLDSEGDGENGFDAPPPFTPEGSASLATPAIVP